MLGAFGLLVPVPAAVGTGVLVVTAAVGRMMSLASLRGSMALVVTAWLRANRLFVDRLRKQFLVWRALSDAERRVYS